MVAVSLKATHFSGFVWASIYKKHFAFLAYWHNIKQVTISVLILNMIFLLFMGLNGFNFDWSSDLLFSKSDLPFLVLLCCHQLKNRNRFFK